MWIDVSAVIDIEKKREKVAKREIKGMGYRP
jgi:hypothetical protein